MASKKDRLFETERFITLWQVSEIYIQKQSITDVL